ncbi:MAG: MGMT family protein [Gemmatimonadota bacterium]
MASNHPGTSYDRIYAVVRRIPRGRVATYGQVATLAGLPRHARLAGYALNALPEGSRLPWHRVVNAQGAVSLRSDGRGHDDLQRMLLGDEGVRFANGRIALKEFQWRPRVSPARHTR